MLKDKRINLRPFEYPEMLDFVTAIQNSYWTHHKWSCKQDIYDFENNATQGDRNIIKNCLLAISQIEVAVKSFWIKVYDHFPKPEISLVGSTFGESEVRHALAYSHLLDTLGLNHDFENLIKVPQIKNRIAYLEKYLKGKSEKSYIIHLILFTLCIENVSLFTQFYIIKSYNQKLNLFKDIDNIISATAQEENIHAKFGAYLINLIKEESPKIYEECIDTIKEACDKSYKAELKIIDWIFENNISTDGIYINEVKDFLKYRFNQSMKLLNLPVMFDNLDVKHLLWFDERLESKVDLDFFSKKSNDYSKDMQSMTSDDLF